jgi:hypothetical protein
MPRADTTAPGAADDDEDGAAALTPRTSSGPGSATADSGLLRSQSASSVSLLRSHSDGLPPLSTLSLHSPGTPGAPKPRGVAAVARSGEALRRRSVQGPPAASMLTPSRSLASALASGTPPPAPLFGAGTQTARERRDRHRRTFSSDLPGSIGAFVREIAARPPEKAP